MSKKTAIIFLANGFEEVEALGTADVLTRTGIDVILTAISDHKTVIGAHNITVIADSCNQDSSLLQNADALILPGGMPGATNLRDSLFVEKSCQIAAQRGAICAAICAAPIALHKFGLLKNKKVTGYPGCEQLSQKPGLMFTGAMIEHDGNIITGKAPGATFLFASQIALALGISQSTVQETLKGMFILQ